jgi:enoyl-CoA hydratase
MEFFSAARDDDSVKGVILTGSRKMAFAMGAEIRDILATEGPVDSMMLSRKGHEVFNLIEDFGKPVVAAINGLALGGGLELAMVCTLRVASEKATFGLPEINLGIIPGYGGTQRLARLIGKGRAMEMILTGEPIDAQEALRIGLVNRVVPRDAVLDEAKALIRKILAKPPVAVRLAMEAVNRGLEMSLDRGLDVEAQLFGLVRSTQDSKEGLAAFLEKREPNFTGT